MSFSHAAFCTKEFSNITYLFDEGAARRVRIKKEKAMRYTPSIITIAYMLPTIYKNLSLQGSLFQGRKHWSIYR